MHILLATLLLWVRASGAAPTLPLTTCRPPGAAEDVLCGSLAVPEDRSAPAGRRIDLRVIVLPALDHRVEQETIFYLEGGPGIAASGAVGLFTTEMRSYRARHALVLVDQRGTGGSNALVCHDGRSPLQRALGEMYPPDYVERCRLELERHADLRLYATPAAAADLDAVRAALGYPRIDLLGLSYGTRLALVYARAYPQRVARMALWGTTPTWATLPLYHAAGAQRALDLVLADCAADPGCRRDHPDLRQRFRDLLATLRGRPVTIEQGGERAELTGDTFVEKLRSLLYTPAGARRVPALIDDVAHGRYDRLVEAASATFPGADGDYLAVTCSEDVARIDPAEAHRVTAGTYAGDYRVRQQMRACAGWPRAELPAGFWDDVESDAPALLLAGDRDPVTPPTWADAVAQHLAHATVLPVPWDAHVPIGLSDLGCFDGVTTRFLDAGTLAGVDVSCLARMAPPPFER